PEDTETWQSQKFFLHLIHQTTTHSPAHQSISSASFSCCCESVPLIYSLLSSQSRRFPQTLLCCDLSMVSRCRPSASILLLQDRYDMESSTPFLQVCLFACLTDIHAAIRRIRKRELNNGDATQRHGRFFLVAIIPHPQHSMS